MNWMTKVIVALAAVFIIVAISGFFFFLTTFLFAFSGGQYRMEPVVQYGALAVIAAMVLLAAVVWKLRSPTAAVLCAAIATPAAWVVAMMVEWAFSFVLGAG